MGFEVGVETNGTIEAPKELDWVCVSPKARAKLVQDHGDELKLVYPQVEPEAQPEQFDSLRFTHFYLQPMDSNDYEANLRRTIEYCLSNPMWRLSLQTHKTVGIL
jgi:organic radical activating enzyme